MKKYKNFRLYELAELVLIGETNRRIKITGRPHSKQSVLNDMLLEYPTIMDKLKDLQK